MCQRCIQKSRNEGRPRSVKPGLLKFLTIQFEKGYPIPLFYERSANYYIEALMERRRMRRTNRKFYRRKGRRHGYGEV